MSTESVTTRDEALAILVAIADTNVNVARIRILLEEELGGEEALDQDDG
jgi:hypothetical protein